MEIPVCNRRCIDLQKKVRRPAGIALPFSTFRVAQRIGAISNKQIFFLLLCHSFYVPFQEDICYSEHMRGISCHLQGILPPLRSSEWHVYSRVQSFVIPSEAGRPTKNLMLLSLGRDSSFHFVPFRMTLLREDCISYQEILRGYIPQNEINVISNEGERSHAKCTAWYEILHSAHTTFRMKKWCYYEHMRGISYHLQGILPPYGRQNDMRLQECSPLSFRARPVGRRGISCYYHLGEILHFTSFHSEWHHTARSATFCRRFFDATRLRMTNIHS